MTLDLLITGGSVVDGTGRPAFQAAIAVEHGRLRIFRDRREGLVAAKSIDATGSVVCPGFIDVHSHSDLLPFGGARAWLKVAQGVTTELVGVDGLSYSPFPNEETLREHGQINAGIGGFLPAGELWTSVSTYLDRVDQQSPTNIATLVGNSALRQATLGWSPTPADATALRTMRTRLAGALDEGAFGLSTGLDYPPGGNADTAELVDLSTIVARHGGVYHSHIRYALGDRFIDPLSEAMLIGRASGVRVHVTHLTRRLGRVEDPQRALDLFHDARRDGVNATLDTLIVREGQTRALILFPAWVHAEGLSGVRAALSDPGQRRRLRDEVRPRSTSWATTWVTGLRRPENADIDGLSVEAIAVRRGQEPVGLLCDLLLDEDLAVGIVFDGVDTDAIDQWLADESTMVSSDGIVVGDHPSPRTAGTFPRLLELARSRQLPLSGVVRRVTSLPAALLGINDRGVVADGMAADLVIFDPGTVGSIANRLAPLAEPAGIAYVVVNGMVVMDHGRWTGALPGRALRAGKIT